LERQAISKIGTQIRVCFRDPCRFLYRKHDAFLSSLTLTEVHASLPDAYNAGFTWLGCLRIALSDETEYWLPRRTRFRVAGLNKQQAPRPLWPLQLQQTMQAYPQNRTRMPR